jgi:glycosyltransferase involved in cell wall biosynthesis
VKPYPVPRHGLALDLQAVQSTEFGDRGIARYAAEQARALLRIPGFVRGLYLNPLLPFPSRLHGDLLSSPMLGWSSVSALNKAQRQGPLAYHVMSPLELHVRIQWMLPEFVHQCEVPLVLSLYDLVPLIMPEHYLTDATTDTRYRQRASAYRLADLILATSQSAAKDAVNLLQIDPRRIAVVGGGVSDFFHPPARDGNPTQVARSMFPSLTRSFVLSVAGTDPRKNAEVLIEAYALLPGQLRRSHQLVIVCQLDQSTAQRWQTLANSIGLAPDEVVFTGGVGDRELRTLYQAANVFVFPSLYEGFGLPVIEAIACGCPALASNASSLPEVIDYPDALFDPGSPPDIAEQLEKALGDPARRDRIIAAEQRTVSGMTWDAVAERCLDAVSRLPPPNTRSRVIKRQLRVALVGPQPPTRSGIAAYHSKLVPELRRRCELDLFYTGSEPPPPVEGVRQFPVSSLGRHINPANYDFVIYVVGNSDDHLVTYDVARAHPGVLWFHDVRLGGFYLSYASARHGGAAREWLDDLLRRMYGSRIPIEASSGFNRDWQARYSLGGTRDWMEHARAALVNSRFAEHLLRLDQGPDASAPPIVRLPFAVGRNRELSDVHTANLDRLERPIVASFGIVDPIKGPYVLIEAMALVRKEVDACLVFVGLVPEAHRPSLYQHASRAGILDAVEFVGNVDDAAYQSWLRSATCAVQWRLATNGEMAASVADCVDAGLPVISNAAGTAEEYPSDVVITMNSRASEIELAAQILDLLRKPELREQQSRAQLSFARVRGFDHLADRLMESLVSLASDSAAKGLGTTGSPCAERVGIR